MKSIICNWTGLWARRPKSSSAPFFSPDFEIKSVSHNQFGLNYLKVPPNNQQQQPQQQQQQQQQRRHRPQEKQGAEATQKGSSLIPRGLLKFLPKVWKTMETQRVFLNRCFCFTQWVVVLLLKNRSFVFFKKPSVFLLIRPARPAVSLLCPHWLA